MNRPSQTSGRRLLVAVPDLFFMTRIRAVAAGVSAAIEACGVAELVSRARETRPDLIIVDLYAAPDPLAAVRALKEDAELRGIPVVGFYSHVDQALRQRAIASGVDRVLPRSAFTRQLAALIGGG